jgi:uncharacterized protein (DUF2267 family)
VNTAPDVPETGVRMRRQEFFGRVAQREGKDVPKTVHDARSVIEVVDEAVQGSVTDRIRQSLDEELAAIRTV